MTSMYGQRGDVLTFTAPVGGVVSGTPVVIGNTFCIPLATAAVNVSFAAAVQGVFSVAKQAGQAISEGANVYWDTGAGTADIDPANVFIGKCSASAAGGDATVSVSLTPGLTTAAGGVAATLFDAFSILAADVDDTPAALTLGASTMVARLAAGGIVAATPAQIRTLLNVADGADAVDSASVDGAGAVMESDYDANSVLAANADNTPLMLAMAANTMLARAAGNIEALAIGDESFVGRSAAGALAGQAVAVQSFVGRAAAGLGGIAIGANELVGRAGGSLGGLAIADESFVGRTAAGAISAIAVAASRIVGRTAAGNLGALTAAEVLALINVEAAADVTDETNVLAALVATAAAKDFGGGAVTNVGLVDGRDVSADGTALDDAVLDVAELGAENLDGHMMIPFIRGLGEAGTWTPSMSGDGLPIVTRTAGAATEEFWVEVPAPARTGVSKGIRPTGLVATYSVNTADANDIRFELWKRTLPAHGAAATAVVVVGQADGDYDGDHDTAAKRSLDTGAPQLHRATVTDAAGSVYLAANEQLMVRAIIDAAAGTAFAITGLELLYAETQVDLV